MDPAFGKIFGWSISNLLLVTISLCSYVKSAYLLFYIFIDGYDAMDELGTLVSLYCFAITSCCELMPLNGSRFFGY